MTAEPPTITVAEVCTVLGLSRVSFYRHADEIGGVHRIGGRIVVSRVAFWRWFEQRDRAPDRLAVLRRQIQPLRLAERGA